MANSRYGVRLHCLNFLGLPPEERFEAAKAAMLKTAVFHWKDAELRHWCRESSHEVHEARQDALKEARAIARDRTAGR